jgi:hypothetical protein
MRTPDKWEQKVKEFQADPLHSAMYDCLGRWNSYYAAQTIIRLLQEEWKLDDRSPSGKMRDVESLIDYLQDFRKELASLKAQKEETIQ